MFAGGGCNCQRLEFSDCIELLFLNSRCNFTTAKGGIRTGLKGYVWVWASQMGYFCEQRERCTLEAAMRNYHDYVFVGTTEEFGLTLRIFEELLPGWFRGTTDNPVPHSRVTSSVNSMTGTRNAGAVSKTARGLLMRDPYFADEVKFYEFCRRKFWLAVDRVLGDTSGGVGPAAVVASLLISFKFHAPLYVGHAELNKATNMLHDVRPAQERTPNYGNATFTWQDVERTVTMSGHPMCVLSRGNWACEGERYGAVLRSTPMFNQSLGLGAFPRGTRIIAQGNSYFAQKIDTILCNSRVDIWADSGATNNLIAADHGNDIVLLLLDNDARWNRNQTALVAAVRASSMGDPGLVVLGDLNGRPPYYNHSYPSDRRCFGRSSRYFCFRVRGRHAYGVGAAEGVRGQLF